MRGLLGRWPTWNERIRQLRRRMGKTTADVGGALGMSASAWARKEAGTRPMLVNELVDACAAIGVDPSLVFLDSAWL